MARGAPRILKRANIVQQSLRVPFDVEVTVDGSSGNGFGSAVCAGLAEANIHFKAAVAYVEVVSTTGESIDADWSGDVSFGTTASADATLGGTDANIIGSTALGPASGGVIAPRRGTGTTAALLDNTDGSLEINLNLSVDDANVADTDSVVRLRGVLFIDATVLGDD